jgi:3-deoxy-D-manno-octulosonate 8-phosphate phosphatase (KDO 8-P phosphatase)
MVNISDKDLTNIARRIRLLILDVDGVMTDGGIILDGRDNELKSFHVRDGHGIKMLIKAGITVALITGRQSKVVQRRARELGITDVFQKSYKKSIAYGRLAEKYSLTDKEIAYAGDDIVDISVMKRCGLPIAVADADDCVKPFAKLITKKKGGRGAVREVCDFILKAKGIWKKIIDEYAEN